MFLSNFIINKAQYLSIKPINNLIEGADLQAKIWQLTRTHFQIMAMISYRTLISLVQSMK